MTGGKFANGAITAAFLSAYNEANHPPKELGIVSKGWNQFFTELGDTASAIRARIEGSITYISDKLSAPLQKLHPTGVVAIGLESTSVIITAGQKGGFGLFVDFDNNSAGTFVKSGIQLTPIGNDLSGGLELQAAVTFDYSPSIDSFRGTSIESGGSLGPIGIDYSIIPNQGLGSGGFDIGLGAGASVMKVTTEAIPHLRF